MEHGERESLRQSLIPNCPGLTANAIEWLITLLARVENLEARVSERGEGEK